MQCDNSWSENEAEGLLKDTGVPREDFSQGEASLLGTDKRNHGACGTLQAGWMLFKGLQRDKTHGTSEELPEAGSGWGVEYKGDSGQK